MPERRASITIVQRLDGYWTASLDAVIPGVGSVHESAENLHTADEAMEWGRSTLHFLVGLASTEPKLPESRLADTVRHQHERQAGAPAHYSTSGGERRG